MELRSGIYKGVHGTLSEQCRSQFAEGLSLLFSRWTALGLAIDNEWGGSSSRQKAEQLYEDVLHWFFTHTEHYADDLEVDLQAAMLQDFNVQLEDDSPREECLQGNFDRLHSLRADLLMQQNRAKSQQEVVDRDGTIMLGEDVSSSDEEGDHSSDESMEPSIPNGQPPDPSMQSQQVNGGQPQQKQAPIIDADGFEVVQRPSRRRGQR